MSDGLMFVMIVAVLILAAAVFLRGEKRPAVPAEQDQAP